MTFTATDDDHTLLQRYARAHDPEAFAILARRYAGLVFSVARRITRSEHDAEDITQSSFLELAKNARTIRSVSGFLHRTATHRAINLRRDLATRRVHETVPRPTAEETDCRELLSLVDSAIEHLPDELRIAIILHYQQSQTQAQIARQLDLSQATVSRRLESAVAQLRSTLEKNRQETITPATMMAVLGSTAASPPAQSVLAAVNKIGLAGELKSAGATSGAITLIAKIAVAMIGVCTILAAIIVITRARAVSPVDSVPGTPVIATSKPADAAAPAVAAVPAVPLISAIPRIASWAAPDRFVGATAISPDGKLVISASSARTGNRPAGVDSKTTLVLWDANTHQKIRAFEGHTRNVNAVKFAPDGKTFASASRDGTVRIWDVNTGSELHRFEALGTWFKGIDFSADGRQLLAGGWGGIEGPRNGNDTDLYLWDVATGKEVVSFAGHPFIILNGAALSPDGRYAAVGSNGSTAYVVDLKTGKTAFYVRDGGDINAVAFSPDSTRLLTGGNAETVCLWDLTTPTGALEDDARSPTLLAEMEGHDDVIQSVAFTGDGKHAISTGGKENPNGRGQGEVRTWDLATKTQIACSRLSQNSVLSISLDTDSTRAVAGSYDGKISTYDLTHVDPPVKADQPHKSLIPAYRTFGGSYGEVRYLEFVDGGKKVLSLCNASVVLEWNSADGSLARKADFGQCCCFAAGLTPANDIIGFATTQLMRFGTDPSSTTYQSYDVVKPEEHRDEITSWNLPIFANGTRAVMVAQKMLIIWDLQTNRISRRIDTTERVDHALVSPDESLILTAQNNGHIRSYSLPEGTLLNDFKTKSPFLYPILFAPDGKSFFRTDNWGDKVVRCDLNTGKTLDTFIGHKGVINAIAVSSDGKILVTASRDKTIRVWDAQTTDEIMQYDVRRLSVSCLAIAPDNKTVASDNPDGSISLWNLPQDP